MKVFGAGKPLHKEGTGMGRAAVGGKRGQSGWYAPGRRLHGGRKQASRGGQGQAQGHRQPRVPRGWTHRSPWVEEGTGDAGAGARGVGQDRDWTGGPREPIGWGTGQDPWCGPLGREPRGSLGGQTRPGGTWNRGGYEGGRGFSKIWIDFHEKILISTENFEIFK